VDLIEAAAVIGSWSWRQARGFEVVGRWVLQEPDPESKIQFFSHSRRKGAHSIQLASLLPVIAGSSPRSFVGPGEGDREVVELLFSKTGGSSEERLGALYEVLCPREVADIRTWLGEERPVNAMPLIRVAAAVLADEEQDLAVGRSILERMRRASK
jgi:hypothetical protein